MTKTYLATKDETIRVYKSLAEVSPACTESTGLADIFYRMAAPSRLACTITNSSVYPGTSGTLTISKTGAHTGTATFVDTNGRMSTGVFPWSGWQSPGYSNPNLLVNWDFRNPVNQRGQSRYTNAGYSIDMWNAVGTNAVLLLENNKLKSITFEGFEYLIQFVEDKQGLTGKTVTLSVYAENVTGAIQLSDFRNFATKESHRDITVGNGITSYTFEVSDDDVEGGITFWTEGNASLNPIAVKLEVGTVSTLALDLMQPSDYAAELRKCQRYLQVVVIPQTPVVCDRDISMILPIGDLPVPMRTKPTAVLNSAASYALPINGGTPVDLSSFHIETGDIRNAIHGWTNALWIKGVTGLSKNQLYVVNQTNIVGNYWSTGAELLISAEL